MYEEITRILVRERGECYIERFLSDDPVLQDCLFCLEHGNKLPDLTGCDEWPSGVDGYFVSTYLAPAGAVACRFEC